MKLTESALRTLTRSIMKELFTKKNPFSAKNTLDKEPRGGDGSIGGYYDDGYYGDDGAFGGFGEADEMDEAELEELKEDEEEVE